MNQRQCVPSPQQPSPSTLVVRRLFYDDNHAPSPVPYNSSLLALAQAPFLTNRVQNISFLISAEEFFEDNPLISATLQPRTQQKYSTALENFRASSFASLPLELPIDHRLCLYIQDSFTQNSNPGNRQEMINLICMILLMYPSLRGANLGLSKRCISGWRALKPARSSAPFTQDITLALSWHLLVAGHTAAAVTLLSTFFACLRVSEALALRIEDIAFPGDARVASYWPHTAGINIRDAKTARHTGRLQFVKIEYPHAIKFLSAWCASTGSAVGPLFSLSYQAYSSQLRAALSSIGTKDASFTSHSARIGKATHDYVCGIPGDQIAINGRWKSLNSLRYYVTNGRAWLLDSHIPPAAQACIAKDANTMRRLLQQLPTSAPVQPHT